jgi:hypothetical protein
VPLKKLATARKMTDTRIHKTEYFTFYRGRQQKGRFEPLLNSPSSVEEPTGGGKEASLWVDCYKRIDYSPKNRTDVRHSSEDTSKLFDVAVNRMVALDGLFGPVDIPPRSNEHFRRDVAIRVGHCLSF